MKLSCFFLVVFAVSCVRHQQGEELPDAVSLNDSVQVKYAEGFDVSYLQGAVQIISHSISGNTAFSDTIIVPVLSAGQDNGPLPLKIPNDELLNNGLNSFACQSTTHLAFLKILGQLHRVKGVCGLEFLKDQDITGILEKNKARELCSAEKVYIETLQQTDPDLFFIYPFETDGKEKYASAGIQTFYIAEYLERTALARLEWIKLFGLLVGEVKLANEYFARVESEYNALKTDTPDTGSTFILNLPYKETWFMPSASSMVVNLIEDAGLSYYYPAQGATENDAHSTEEVWNDAMFADYWIIMASRPPGFSMTDLLAEEPVYKEFLSVKKNQVIFCNTTTSDYFVQGVVEPHVILKDLLYATGQITNHDPVYFFRLQ